MTLARIVHVVGGGKVIQVIATASDTTFRQHVASRIAHGATWKAAIIIEAEPEGSAKHRAAQRAVRQHWNDQGAE